MNPEREAKRKKEYAKKLRDYKRSETCKAVAARAGGRCEFTVVYHAGGTTQTDRCDETEGLEHHHLKYGRLGGNELPEDIQVLCKTHHRWMEATQHPTRKRQ